MRIGIDARFLTHPQLGGFKTYTENLVTALASIDVKNEYFLYLDREPSAHDLIPLQSNFHTRVIAGTLPAIGLPWREQVVLSRQAKRDRVDLFHSPCLTAPIYINCPLVITVHDMIWAFPQRFSRKTGWSPKRKFMEWYNFLAPSFATRRASAIITVSHAAQQSILDYMNISSDKLTVTWEAARSSFVQVNNSDCLENVRTKFGLDTKFILAIGSADPRKNINSLVKAYALLPQDLQEQYHLAIVWTHTLLADGLFREVSDLGLENRIRFLQNVSNEDLVYLYNSSTLFVFPSLHEGFGLPILEAMACGTPVVAANNSSIPEIAGDAALLFETQDIQGMSDAISQILVNENLRSELVKKGLDRSATFSWEKCARETLSVYYKVNSS